MFKAVKDFFCAGCFGWATGPDCGDFGTNHIIGSQNVSPDSMIVNGLIQSFASEFDDWKLIENSQPTLSSDCRIIEDKSAVKVGKYEGHKFNRTWRKYSGGDWLRNEKKGIVISRIIEISNRDGDNRPPYMYYIGAVEVNKVAISDAEGGRLLSEYKRLKERHDTAKETAAKALANQKANEAKWNIVEQVLGMKRTKTGRLIAVSSFCPVCDASEVEKGAKHNLSCPNAPVAKPRRPKVIDKPFKEATVLIASKHLQTGGKICDCWTRDTHGPSILVPGDCDGSCCI